MTRKLSSIDIWNTYCKYCKLSAHSSTSGVCKSFSTTMDKLIMEHLMQDVEIRKACLEFMRV